MEIHEAETKSKASHQSRHTSKQMPTHTKTYTHTYNLINWIRLCLWYTHKHSHTLLLCAAYAPYAPTHNLHNANFHNWVSLRLTIFGKHTATSHAISSNETNSFHTFWSSVLHRQLAFICYSGSGKTNSIEHFVFERIIRICRLIGRRLWKRASGGLNFPYLRHWLWMLE